MSTRSKTAEETILAELKAMRGDMLTKAHFDSQIEPIKEKLALHDTQISNISERLTKVESTKESYAEEVYKEMYEQEKRKNNVVIFSLDEQDQELTKMDILKKEKLMVTALFTDMKLLDPTDDKIDMRISRIGAYNTDKIRPLKVMLNNTDVKNQILSAAKNLKGKKRWKKVSIASDLTKTQQQLAKKKREELATLAAKKNSERSTDEIDQGVKYKMVGNYGRYNLRMIRVVTHSADVLSEDE